MLVTIFESMILGLVQGATEFIPISSSAHLIIIPWLFGWTDPALTSLSFDVALHMGTLLAVLVFFARDWIFLIKSFLQSLIDRRIGSKPERKLVWLVLLGTIPGGIAGVLFESRIDNLFHQPGVPIRPISMVIMAGILAIFGVLLWLADRVSRHYKSLDGITLRDTILIGISQAMAIFPGVSRSGSTITTGLALGFKRDSTAKFSFLLSAPIIAGAGLKSMWEVYSGLKMGTILQADLILFPFGFIMAAISGFLCIRFLMNYLQKHSINAFVYYRWALALFIIGIVLVRG